MFRSTNLFSQSTFFVKYKKFPLKFNPVQVYNLSLCASKASFIANYWLRHFELYPLVAKIFSKFKNEIHKITDRNISIKNDKKKLYFIT